VNDDLLQTARFLADGMVRPDLIEIFDRFAAGDESAMQEFQPLIELVDPDLVWDSTELAVPDFPDVVYGPAAVMEFFRSWLAAWADFAWETDLPLDQHVTHRMTFRDGKLVAWRLFVDRRDA
jgi:hypothetical protein